MKDNFSQKHAHDLKKSGGLPGNGAIKYEYILTKDQLYDTYLNRMDDLGYPLRVEPKRDRYVMNSKVLEKAFEDATTKALKQLEDEIYNFVDKEVMNVIDHETYNLLNTITVSSGEFITHRKPINKSSWASRFGKLLGKELAKTAMKIFDDTINPKRSKRR